MIRQAIIKRMKELNLNPIRLSEILKGKIPRQTVYDFLSGRTDARSEVVSELIKVLGLELKVILWQVFSNNNIPQLIRMAKK